MEDVYGFRVYWIRVRGYMKFSRYIMNVMDYVTFTIQSLFTTIELDLTWIDIFLFLSKLTKNKRN